MDPEPSASQVWPPAQDFHTQMSHMLNMMSQFTNFLGMAGVNKPTTLREVVKEVIEEAVPNYLSVAAPPLVTVVTSGAPPTPGDRELMPVATMTVFLYRLRLTSHWVVSFVRTTAVWETISHLLLPRKPREWLRILQDELSTHELSAHLVTEVSLRVWSMSVTMQPHLSRCDGGQTSATPPARERSTEVVAVQVTHAPHCLVDGQASADCHMGSCHNTRSVSTHSTLPALEEGNWAAQGSVAPWHPNVGESVRPHPPASRLDDDPDPLHQTCDPRHATHEDLYQISEEEEQHTVSEPSDFLKLANFIYDKFGEAKGVRETRHDRAPGPGQEDFVLLQETPSYPFAGRAP
ncbi:hypothetical protein E2C01_075743 [Portunus trituberculatus]|uniref:Uncharacterized protein n=1 Tax=Portunus trituberculatus TaxID=210409 RepID=A0A5B7IBF6_PORTR|nr:hypothetical protein [Portunus trituberculatus]